MSEKETWESHEKSCGGGRSWSSHFSDGCFVCSTCKTQFKYPSKGDAVRDNVRITEWGIYRQFNSQQWDDRVVKALAPFTVPKAEIDKVLQQAGVSIIEKKNAVALTIAPPVAAKIEKHLCTCSYEQVAVLGRCICGGR